MISGEPPQNICSSARRIFDGAAVAAARKSNAADGKIDKEVWLKVNVSVYWCSFVFVENLRNLKNFPPFF